MNIEELLVLAKKVYSKRNRNFKDFKIHIPMMREALKNGQFHQVGTEELSEVELLTIFMIEGRAYDIIQEPAFGCVSSNEFTDELIRAFDSALRKTPKCTCNLLYRGDGHPDCQKYQIGQTVAIKGYFTTSIDDFDNEYKPAKWIISPLPKDNTKSHEIYRIYNHGENLPCPEYQVEFERNTIFLITQIEQTEYCRTIYVNEIE